MSKFSEALGKIQAGRGPEPRREKSVKDVPAYRGAEESKSRAPSWDTGIKLLKNANPQPVIVTSRFPNSLITEQYRMLRTSLKAQCVKDGVQVIMVSSSLHSEGKSVTSTNLALSLAEDENVKVALIDADLRKGKIHDYLGFGKEHKGLSHLLEENLNPKEVMLRSVRSNLCVIPRGFIPKNPSSVIGSEKFRILIAELRTMFDYIIIDAPPIMSVADPGIIARDVDGVLFVIQIGRTPKTMIAHSNMLFKQAGARMLGYVLTNVEYQNSEYRYYNNYYESYEENSPKFKDKAKFHLKRVGMSLESSEGRFNKWWNKAVLKREK